MKLGISILTLVTFLLLTFAPLANFASAAPPDKSNAPGKSAVAADKKAAVAQKKIDRAATNYQRAFEKSDKANRNAPKSFITNAGLYEESVDEVVDVLQEVAEEEEEVGNEEVSDELEEIIEEEEEVKDDVVEAIEEVESRNKFKTFLIGSDYRNLGALRSSLVHDRNQIRKLTKTAEKVGGEGSSAAIEEQMAVLLQERERIKDVIVENEEGFSILGWVFRFLSGYPNEPIPNGEEPTIPPSPTGSGEPTGSPEPTSSAEPTQSPTSEPTSEPTDSPTSSPTDAPTL